MCQQTKALLTSLALTATITLGGCSADLIAMAPPGQPNNPTGFCKENSFAVVSVKNNGNANAPPSVTTVKFGAPGVPVDIATPAINAGSSADLVPIPLPAGCFNPDCDFAFTVDSHNQVKEGNEGNNTAPGICIG